MSNSPSPLQPVKPASFLDKLQSVVNLQYVLKIGGVVVLAIVLATGFHRLNFFQKTGMVVAPIMWLVGARFDKIYK